LFLSADNDDRVDPLHARKMAAALQTYTKGTAPILLRIEAQAGHGGADLVKEQVAENVDMYSFLMARFGMTLK
jgi:prolyl oligopeptidase